MYVKYIKYISSLPFTSSKRSSKQSVNMLLILSHLLLISPMYISLCPPLSTTHNLQLTTHNTNRKLQITPHNPTPQLACFLLDYFISINLSFQSTFYSMRGDINHIQICHIAHPTQQPSIHTSIQIHHNIIPPKKKRDRTSTIEIWKQSEKKNTNVHLQNFFGHPKEEKCMHP